MAYLLEVKGLKTYFPLRQTVVKAVDGIDLAIAPGETLGLVGESGSGKSVTALSILRLVPPPGEILSGEIWFRDQNLLQLSDDEMRRVRGRGIAMVFQDPTAYLNPLMKVGRQIMEIIQVHEELNKADAREKTIGILDRVGIPSPDVRVDDYPHQFSGGMRQRILIAITVACSPDLLIADEPTTALDVTIEAQILDLLRRLQSESGLSILLITHDLAVVAEMCQQVTVMYAGQIVESGSTRDTLSSPFHPYTQGLIQALPRLGRRKERLTVIEGNIASASNPPPGCRFHPRCPIRKEVCSQEPPPVIQMDGNRKVNCYEYVS